MDREGKCTGQWRVCIRGEWTKPPLQICFTRSSAQISLFPATMHSIDSFEGLLPATMHSIDFCCFDNNYFLVLQKWRLQFLCNRAVEFCWCLLPTHSTGYGIEGLLPGWKVDCTVLFNIVHGVVDSVRNANLTQFLRDHPPHLPFILVKFSV